VNANKVTALEEVLKALSILEAELLLKTGMLSA
jgi:hypothetical protein